MGVVREDGGDALDRAELAGEVDVHDVSDLLVVVGLQFEAEGEAGQEEQYVSALRRPGERVEVGGRAHVGAHPGCAVEAARHTGAVRCADVVTGVEEDAYRGLADARRTSESEYLHAPSPVVKSLTA